MNFKDLLKECDYTASRLARELGINKQTVSHWANRKTAPTAPMIMKISKALGRNVYVVVKSFSVIPTGEEEIKKKGKK